MNDEQFARWRDFALRMAKTCFKGARKPSRKEIIGMGQEFFDDIEQGAMHIRMDDLPTIVAWEHSTEYPEGNPLREREYDTSWCDCNGYRLKHKNKPNPKCPECHGSGVHHAWKLGPLLCDAVTMYDEHWMPDYWDDEDEAAWEARRDRWCNPPRACIRAGFDCAVSPSMGVVGFTAGDIRRMYPKGVPDWVKNGDWETIGVKVVVPGVGFVPDPKGDAHRFDAIPDEAGIWI